VLPTRECRARSTTAGTRRTAPTKAIADCLLA
jgi:hypothetical protein